MVDNAQPEAGAQSSSVADQLRRYLPELTTAERRVARSLLAGYPAAGLGTVADIAEQASTSSATVIRLVQKLGYAGYPNFQAMLREELSVRRSGPVERLQSTPPDWSDSSSLVPMAISLSEVARSVIQTVPAAEFDAAVALLADRSLRIFLLGGRLTHHLAAYLGQHLTRLRTGISVLSRSPAAEVGTLLEVGKRDVFVIFDLRRYEQETVEIARMAALRGSRIVVVTDIYMSPAARNATVVLPIQVQVASPFDSAVAGFVLVEALATSTLQALGDVAVKRMKRWDALAERLHADELCPSCGSGGHVSLWARPAVPKRTGGSPGLSALRGTETSKMIFSVVKQSQRSYESHSDLVSRAGRARSARDRGAGPESLNLVRKSVGGVDGVEGLAEVVGEGAGGSRSRTRYQWCSTHLFGREAGQSGLSRNQ